MIGDGTQQRVIVQIGVVQTQFLVQIIFHAHHPARRFQAQFVENILQFGQVGRRIQILTASAAMPRSSNRDTAARDLLQRGLWKI
ncbi:Uncharacterised protein [Neisseria gonorrhoeae]|uniref:Uncharacterized protein n=1 Tax=Neisseria gonorrhoeae TaxID=485 RepID=A0A378W3M8_NEIGO|nr:Uncharacterised protein [Neisseria gonorrhoeae]